MLFSLEDDDAFAELLLKTGFGFWSLEGIFPAEFIAAARARVIRPVTAAEPTITLSLPIYTAWNQKKQQAKYVDGLKNKQIKRIGFYALYIYNALQVILK